ncbi:voltage-gated delayed rectifier potassium channel KCNH1-like [Littorina saxatilis]|uniref:voltage-gated delayed rectifier potassium channel KCNH1-like n=1 Tax=Littorina saxatilis TaxID=31220 RepID=UPI0038B50734
MPGGRRGLVAPQNTFVENIIRRSNGQHSSFVLANARIVDYPIVYCNDGFCKLSGYNRAEVMQKSSTCAFMYGELTDKEAIAKTDNAFENTVQEQVEILLYKKNKTPLWLLLHIAPVKNEKDQVVLFLCTFKDITALKQPIDDEGGKGLSKFARLARSVTRNRTTLLQFSSNIPNTTFDNSRPSQIANMMNLSADVLPQYRLEAPKTPPHIILHYCLFKTIWDWVILILTFYTAVMVPYNAAFKIKTMDQLPLLVIDSMVDVVFFVDIVLNFHTTFVGSSGEVISDPKIIRMNYLKSWFVIDLLSCLPYDVFNAFQYVDDGISTLFSALKVVRLLRLGRVVRKLDHYLEYGAAMLILLILVFILFAHWFACIWYSIGSTELNSGVAFGWLQTLAALTKQPFRTSNASASDDYIGGPSTEMRYLTALYFTLSCMTGVGFGNVSANTQTEKLFSVFMMIIGSLLYALIFSNVTTIFQQFYSSFARYHDMLNSVREFMKLHDVPKSLSERVMDYIVSTWAITKGIDITKVLNYCPKDMKADLCVHLNRKVFLEHPAFRLASDGCLRALAMHFNMTHSAPGDLIFHQGESLDSLCFVVSGSLEVIQDEEVVAILSKGDVFGDNFWRETAIGQSTANVRALTYCDLHSIKRDRLLEVLDFYHAFANSFARNLTLTYNLRHRLIFRKVADVKKEKELAEKRKNDPPLELANDHPVRKLISRFRKVSDTKSHPATDVEKVGNVTSGAGSNHSDAADKAHKMTRVINVSENNVKMPKLGGGGGVKWTKFLGGGNTGGTSTADVTPDSNHMTPDTNQNNIGMNDLSGKHLEAKAKEAPKVTVKPQSKWGRMFAKPQEPIQESPEDDVRNNLKKTDSTDSGILRSNNRLDQIGGEPQERAPVNRDSVGSLGGPLSAAEQHMLTSLYDIRLEIKEEMDNLGQKINRIDGSISEILRFFTPSSTPCSSSSTYPSSKLNSPQNITSSVEQSPKKRQSSPPYRMGLASGLRVRASVVSSGDSTASWGESRVRVTSPSHPEPPHGIPSSPSSENVSSSSSNNNSRRSSKSSSTSHDGGGNGRGGAGGGGASGGSGGSGGGGGEVVQVRPSSDPSRVTHSASPHTAYQVPTDDDNVHVKDRDLDIL